MTARRCTRRSARAATARTAQGKMGPAIKGKTNVADVITKGGLKGPHAKPINGVSDDQAKAIGDFVAGLK